MTVTKFQINKWEKYNPRNDRNNFSWFRFQNDFFTDPLIFSLCTEAKMLIIFMFCEGSKGGSGKGTLNFKMAASHIGTSESSVKKFAKDIENIGVASFDNQKTPDDGIMPPNGSPTYGRTDVTNEQTNDTDIPQNQKVIEILDYWNSKNIVQHKATDKIIEKIKKGLKKQRDCKPDQIKQAIDNYSMILKGNEYLWTHKWTLWEFLTRENADKFYPDEFDVGLFPLNKQGKTFAQQKQDNLVNMENPYAK